MNDFTPAPMTPLGARTPHAHPALYGIIAGLALIIFAGAYLVWADLGGHWPYQTFAYRNTQYGFSIPLPSDWQGYTVLTQQWEGRDVNTGIVTQTGPKIVLRNPLWTAATPYEDMPVMVFTPSQWALVQSESLAVSAAPIPPSMLGQNSEYILALPARYNFDYATGFEQVDTLVHGLVASEPTP